MEETLQLQPGGRRRAILLAFLGFFVAISVGGLGLIVQLYLKSLGAPIFLIGLVSTLNAIGMLAGSWLWGTLSDFIKRRRLLAFLTLGLASCIGLLILMPSTPLVMLSAAVRSLMFAGVSTVSIAVVSASSLPQRRGKNLSYISSAQAMGFAIGNVLAGIVLAQFGFRPTFILFTMLALMAFGTVWTLPNENPIQRVEKVGAWKAIFSSGLFDLFFATALRQMAIFGAFALLYVYMESVGIPVHQMGFVSASNSVTQVAAILVFGWLADRVGRRRIFMLGFFLSAVVPLLFMFATSILAMIGTYIVLGIAYSSLFVGSAAFIGDRVPLERHGQMLGLYSSSRSLGGLFGPVLAGALTPVIGFRGMFMVMACIAALGFVVMIVGWLRGGRRDTSDYIMLSLKG